MKSKQSLSIREQIKIIELAQNELKLDSMEDIVILLSGAIVDLGFAGYVINSWIDIVNYIPSFNPVNIERICKELNLSQPVISLHNPWFDENDIKTKESILNRLKKDLLAKT